MAKMSILLNTKSLLDITLAAEGKFIKAHRVILAASSKYFEDLLFDSHEHQPMIFFRDVGFTELEVLVQLSILEKQMFLEVLSTHFFL